MKKLVSPLILFAGAFLSTLLLQKDSFVLQEYEGLFLLSGDYFSTMLRTPFPLSGIIADFLTQFFRFGVYAPLIVAAAVTAAFFLTRSILRRFALYTDILPAALSCALWIAIAFAPTARRGVAAVLILFLVWLASRLLPRRQARKTLPFWTDLAASAIFTSGAFLFLALSGTIRERERTASLKVAAVMSDWDRILAIATPERAAADPEIMPYAFLAMGEKGRLGDDLFRYPVQSRSDFDFCERPEDEVRYFFNTVLYETLQCPNEAIHNYFQLATYQDHGQSFLVLRRLLSDYYSIGNYDLARKYAAVLSRSTLHSQYVRHFTDRMAEGTPREADSLAFRTAVPLITRDPLANLILLGAGGINAPASLDRVLCSLLLQKNLDDFQAVFNSARDRYPAIPRYYEEALVLAGRSEGISEKTLQRYSSFQGEVLAQPGSLPQFYRDSYWYYYFSDDEIPAPGKAAPQPNRRHKKSGQAGHSTETS